ncbi:hypothetical protein Trydic_g2108 [Trypoxylus dichotomus]
MYSWIEPYPELVKDGDKIFCRACSKLVSSKKKFLIDQHAKTLSHIRKCQKLERSGSLQQSRCQCAASNSRKLEQEDFDTDLRRKSVYGSKWFAWENLKFLDDAEELRALSNSTPENKVCKDNADIEQKNRELIDETGEDDSQENSYSGKTLVSSPKKRILSHKIPLLRCTEDGRIQRRHNISVNTSVTTKKDECAMFGEFISEKMRKLNARSRAILQDQIHTLILQTETGNQVLLQPAQLSQQIISLDSPNPSQTPSTSYHSPSILPNSSSHSSLPQHYDHILQQNNDDITIKVEDSVIS